MGRAVKIAISLPEALLEAAEAERQARGESRSEFIRHAIEEFLRRERNREEIERYIRGYLEQPETEDEAAAIHQASLRVLAQEPWE